MATRCLALKGNSGVQGLVHRLAQRSDQDLDLIAGSVNLSTRSREMPITNDPIEWEQ